MGHLIIKVVIIIEMEKHRRIKSFSRSPSVSIMGQQSPLPSRLQLYVTNKVVRNCMQLQLQKQYPLQPYFKVDFCPLEGNCASLFLVRYFIRQYCGQLQRIPSDQHFVIFFLVETATHFKISIYSNRAAVFFSHFLWLSLSRNRLGTNTLRHSSSDVKLFRSLPGTVFSQDTRKDEGSGSLSKLTAVAGVIGNNRGFKTNLCVLDVKLASMKITLIYYQLVYSALFSI